MAGAACVVLPPPCTGGMLDPPLDPRAQHFPETSHTIWWMPLPRLVTSRRT